MLDAERQQRGDADGAGHGQCPGRRGVAAPGPGQDAGRGGAACLAAQGEQQPGGRVQAGELGAERADQPGDVDRGSDCAAEVGAGDVDERGRVGGDGGRAGVGAVDDPGEEDVDRRGPEQ